MVGFSWEALIRIILILIIIIFLKEINFPNVHLFVFFSGNKHLDPDHFTATLQLIQRLSASESEAYRRLLENCGRAGLKVHGKTPGDGSCFFHAISYQLGSARAITSVSFTIKT